MKIAQSFNNLVNPQLTHKYIPSPEIAEIILAYFVYNNFQDFNTWQQIAKTKVEYDYSQNIKGMFICKTTLKWEDRPFPTIVQCCEAKSKKTAKKRALGKLIENIIYQGYIGVGFKEENFAEKLPRRRKNDSDDSSEEGEEEKYPSPIELRAHLISNHHFQALTILQAENPRWKHIEVFQCWNYGLSIGSLSFLTSVLRTLQKVPVGNEEQLSQKDRNESGKAKSQYKTRQYSYGKQVKDPLSEDLTDFIRYYQLQKPPATKNLRRKPDIRPQPIPSQHALSSTQTHSPSRQQLIQNFHPIEGRKLFLHPLQQHSTTFLGDFQHIELPKFQELDREIPLKIVEQMYNLIFYYCLNYEFAISTIEMMEKEIKNVGMTFNSTVKAQYREMGQAYYLRNKNVLCAEFLLLLQHKIESQRWNLSIEGMLLPQKNQQHLFVFNCKEPQDVLNKKINRRSNLSQFEQMREISVNQFVLLVSKLAADVQYVAQVVELIPTFKLYVPALSQEYVDPYPFTIVKLYNSKIYQKTSSSIIQVAKNYMEMIETQTTLLWQPPSYPILSVIVELLVEWMTAKCTVLIISMNCQSLHAELTSLGVKAVKLTAKTEQKMMAKCNIVVAYPGTVCCDLLKHYAFTRVLVHGANQISEIMTLSALVKGCKKLYLIGDPYLPRMSIQSPYCKSRGMDISLFQRLYDAGNQTQTFFSRLQNNMQFANTMEWANKYLYNNKLMLIGSEQQTPIVKGFPWPSYNYRVCFLHHSLQSAELDYLNNQAFLCSFICAQVVKSGYTQFDQITCSTADPRYLGLMQFHFSQLLKIMKVADPKLFSRYMSRLARHVTGSSYFRSDLSIMMAGANSQSVSCRQIVGALHQGHRGVIIIGDAYRLSENDDWSDFINWCSMNKLISKVYI